MTENAVGPSTYFRPEHAAGLDARTRELIERRERAMGGAYRLFYRQPVEFVRGAGTKLYTAQGEEFLDAYNNVPSVGHAHPRVVAAIAEQAALLNTHTRYLHPAVIEYSERLLATLPADIGHVMLTCTGSEANDLALRVARDATGNSGVIVTDYAYHGVTIATASLSPSLIGAAAVEPWVRLVPSPIADPQAFVGGVRDAIVSLDAAGFSLAALFVDTVFSSDGVYADGVYADGVYADGVYADGVHVDGVHADAGAQTGESFLQSAVDLVHGAGGLFVADEVQAGFGRLGHGMWGFDRYGVVPDAVTFGKPAGNGMPIAGFAARSHLIDGFGSRGRYFNTFGGTPVSVAAAHAVLDVIGDENLIANADRVGSRLAGEIAALDAPEIGALRGAGLYYGIDIVDEVGNPDEPRALAIVNGMRDRRVLIAASGAHNHTLKVRPPLPFDDADVDRFASALAETLESVRR